MQEYWGDKAVPEEDDFDLWLKIQHEPEEEPSEEEAEEIEERLEELAEIIDDIGPSTVLEAVYEYMLEMPRPFARIARQVRKLAGRCSRMLGAMEEARQTRSGNK